MRSGLTSKANPAIEADIQEEGRLGELGDGIRVKIYLKNTYNEQIHK